MYNATSFDAAATQTFPELESIKYLLSHEWSISNYTSDWLSSSVLGIESMMESHLASTAKTCCQTAAIPQAICEERSPLPAQIPVTKQSIFRSDFIATLIRIGYIFLQGILVFCCIDKHILDSCKKCFKGHLSCYY